MSSPYVIDRPLTDRDLFVGRERLFQAIKRDLVASRRLFLLAGKQGIGRTSFINQLDARLGVPFRVIRLHWAQQADDIACDPLAYILQEAARVLGQPEPDASELFDLYGQGLIHFLDRLFSRVERTVYLLCFDDVPLQAVIDDSRWLRMLSALNAYQSQMPNLAFLVSISGIPPAEGELGALMASIPGMILGALDADDAEDLISIPVRGRLSYDYESLKRIHSLTGGEPFFVQILGHILFEQRASMGWVGLQQVDQAMRTAVQRYDAVFEQMWRVRQPAEQLVLCALAEMIGRHGYGSAAEIARHMAGLRIQIPQSDLHKALADLERQQVIDRLGGDTFRQRNHLFRQWIKEHHDSLSTLQENEAYRRQRLQRSSPLISPRTDWGGILLWLIAGLLAVGIFYVWRSREQRIVWTVEPTPAPTRDVGVTPTVARLLPTPERGVAPGHIVYAAKEELDWKWDIYVMRSDGSDPIRVTNHDSNDTSPTWSPDGRSIAFVSDRDGNREIYAMNADGNDQVNLSRNGAEDWTPSWSPDGTQIAFASFRDGNWEIYVMGADGANPSRLTSDPAADYGPSWSPDGQRLAFSSQRDGNLEIYIINADGTGLSRFTDHSATDQSPVFSPDGTEMMWQSYRDGDMEIYAARIDGADIRNISQDAYADDHGPTWSPWGGRVAYYSNRDGGWDIYSLDLETGEHLNLTSSPGLEQSPHWGP